MKSLSSLISRNIKIYFRDRTLLLLSLLSVFIVILLYAVFLQQTQLDAIKALVGSTDDSKAMVNECGGGIAVHYSCDNDFRRFRNYGER